MRALDAIATQRGHLFPWVPVFLGTGIGIYFLLHMEPDLKVWSILAVLGLGLAALCISVSEGLRPLIMAVLLVLCGVGLGGLRTTIVAAPKLEFRFYGTIEGRIIKIDRSQSNVPRLTLDHVVLKDVPPHRTPERIRVALHGDQAFLTPEPGMWVGVVGHLSPPPPPPEPDGFAFDRMAWFDRLGAVGYARNPALSIAPRDDGTALWIHRLRAKLSTAIRARMGGETGAFAATILTGDRSTISQPTLDALRATNLAHLLAISGLHMGLLTGAVFAALRGGLALVPWVALRWPVKKIAAVGALAAAAFYLGLSGGSVATQRAFVMVAVMLVAVLADRRALTLRAVGIAATIILVLQPESLVEPGFQMSFAATTALVAAFGVLRDLPEKFAPPNWAKPILAVVISSAVAGAATAPIGAAHFNQVAQYGLLANLLSVPMMGALVMPSAVLAACLLPLGLEGIGLWAMAGGIDWILWVADWIAGMDGAVWPVIQPKPLVIPLMASGLLFLMLWQGQVRLVGVGPALVAVLFWSASDRPTALVSSSGGLVGVLGGEGRSLSKPRGDGFAAESWLENDGDKARQDQAVSRSGFEQSGGLRQFTVAGQPFVHLTGRGWRDRLQEACASGWVFLPYEVEAPPQGCTLFDAGRLAETGAIAIWSTDDGPHLRFARVAAGHRPWTQ